MIRNKEYYKDQFQKACEEIARLQAMILSLREDIRTITSTRTKGDPD